MNKDKIKVALVGNPNTGKTSLLNCLTKSSLHVGNWPGKTVQKKEGSFYTDGIKIEIVDLPGSYGLEPFTDEEKIAREFLESKRADVVVQIVDVNCLTRNLLMTFELLTLNSNLIIALNFNEEARRRGIKIDLDSIRKVLKLPIVEIEADTRMKRPHLIKQIIKSFKNPLKVPKYIKSLEKGKGRVNHKKAIRFLKRKIDPHFQTERCKENFRKIDKVILNNYLGYPILITVVCFMFFLTFILSEPLINFIDKILTVAANHVGDLNWPEVISSLLIQGLVNGIGTILSFSPLIFILFFFIGILEDSGYLPRAIVLVDKIFERFGLSGRSFIPMILGLTCNVPAILATRTIKSKKEKYIAIFTNSFISCSARLPIYALFTSIFFGRGAVLTIVLIYVYGILSALFFSLILNKTIQSSGFSNLIKELPAYRVPNLGNLVRRAYSEMRLFIKKAGSIILLLTIIIWLLAYLPVGAEYASEYSILGRIGKFLSPVFQPIGLESWIFIVPLIIGFVAKEAIIGTLGTLIGVQSGGLENSLRIIMTPLSSLSYVFFILLYSPCLATISTIKKETGSWKFVFAIIISHFIYAWLTAFVVFRIGMVLA